MAKTRYLICNYYMVPVKPGLTSVAGWHKDPANVQYDEQISFDSKVRNKDQSASIILDLKDKTIVQNRLDPKLTYDQSFEYFYKAYKSHMDAVIKNLDQTQS
jgi:hypothetical protein